MYIVLDAQETKQTSSNILRVRSQVTTLDARMPGRERERAKQSIRMDAGNLGTAHVCGNHIPKPSRSSTRKFCPITKKKKSLRPIQKLGISDAITDKIRFATVVGRCDSRENQDQYGLTRDDIKRCDQRAIDMKSTSATDNILRQARERFPRPHIGHADKIDRELDQNICSTSGST